MEYKLRIGEDEKTIQFDSVDDNRFTAKVEDRDLDVTHARISPNQLQLTVNGKGASVFTCENGDGKVILINGAACMVQDADDLSQQLSGKKGPVGGPTEVTPPMPAVVVKVNVEEGQAVEEGQPVVVVSAMKMETTLKAPYAGTVTKVNVAEGDKVTPKQILVDIEKLEEAA